MQNLDFDKENENPQHFPSNTASTSEHINHSDNKTSNNDNQEDLSKGDFSNSNSSTDNETNETNENPTTSEAARPKFSFASNYTPAQHFSSSFAAPSTSSLYQHYGSHLPLSSSVSAFTVLNNNDYLSGSGSSSSYLTKPNAIVHPIRRSEAAALPKNQPSNVLSSRDLRITGISANAALSVTHPQYSRDIHNFAEELQRKLSSLHEGGGGGSRDGLSKFKNSSQNGSNQETLNQRPLFITTVPRGIFLPPPNEITLISPSRKRQLYAYSSHPVVYNANEASSMLYSQYQHQHHYSRQPQHIDHTHNAHKIKSFFAGHHNHQQQPPYNNRNSSQTMAKDKYSNVYAGSTSGANAGGGGGARGHSIANADKDLSASKASLRLNGVRGPYASSAATGADAATSPPVGGITITKQQFQQQLQLNRSKRETPPIEPYKNIMHDRRVVRGSNYGTTSALLSDYDPFDKAAEFRRRQALRKRNISQRNQRNVLGTPPPVTGRRHEDVQTDKYLEHLVSRPPEFSVETQTDLFLEKPPTPPYVPAKVGVDVSTEICEGELFQFDVEAQPIIDTLVDSIMEMSVLEVAHEREIESIREKQAELLAQREAELAELRRLEAEEVRLQAEKERRLHQDKVAKSLDEDMQKEVTAAKLLQGHIASILPEILDNLEPATDAAKREKLMEKLCPWLSAEVAEEVGHIVDSREILTVIIQEIIKQRAEIYADYKEEGPTTSTTKLEHIEEEELEAREAAEESCETDSIQAPDPNI
ncbi:radial spoke head protein 3 homolog A [Stomoxys calcitrans]|uniref:radial spoke head protein 3 homolog A n=1 Tax=Stomoxys calcitrans TaxID=35570 RepID=UPI0027E366D3|nr:radial spoke head protein 3 homolog A [Stomoxys calcitrans]